ncbi:transcriptional regulator [Corynebacterium camporealensis]
MTQLDPIIHPLPRFKICAVLNAYQAVGAGESVRREMQFAVLRKEVDMSAASLSKQLNVLEDTGYIERFREYGSTRSKDKVWVMLSEQGVKAFEEHLAALKEAAGGSF